jgi:hypothetical protein
VKVWVVEIVWRYEGSLIAGLFKEKPSDEAVRKLRTIDIGGYVHTRGDDVHVYEMEVQ